MEIKTKFAIGQNVIISAISWPGVVLELRVRRGGVVDYMVEYWRDMKLESVILNQEEICAAQKPNS